MAWIDHPDALSLAGFPPAKGAAGAHETFEDFREMPGVKDDQAHASKDTELNPCDSFVQHRIMRGMGAKRSKLPG
jgi:hypothetical protein